MKCPPLVPLVRLLAGLAASFSFGLATAGDADVGAARETYAPKQAPHVDIISPEVPQTWAYFQIWHKEFRWDDARQALTAVVEFTDGAYADEVKPSPLERQRVIFPFPRVTFDPATGFYSAPSKRGKAIPLLQKQDQALGPRIVLLPTSRVSLFNFSGKITLVLSGTTDPAFATGGPKWITKNHGWYLQNLLGN
jgi:hypothetical protein